MESTKLFFKQGDSMMDDLDSCDLKTHDFKKDDTMMEDKVKVFHQEIEQDNDYLEEIKTSRLPPSQYLSSLLFISRMSLLVSLGNFFGLPQLVDIYHLIRSHKFTRLHPHIHQEIYSFYDYHVEELYLPRIRDLEEKLARIYQFVQHGYFEKNDTYLKLLKKEISTTINETKKVLIEFIHLIKWNLYQQELFDDKSPEGVVEEKWTVNELDCLEKRENTHNYKKLSRSNRKTKLNHLICDRDRTIYPKFSKGSKYEKYLHPGRNSKIGRYVKQEIMN